MGPVIIFDKSALQMLSIDESCWLENFFLTNITPLFYVESLADLSKTQRDRRTPNQVVSELAVKTPTMSCYPNIHHGTLIYNELLGKKVPMDGRPLISGGKSKITKEGQTVIDNEGFPEVDAMMRWQDQKFMELENMLAQRWRIGLAGLNIEKKVALVKNIVPITAKLRTLEEIYNYVKNFIENESKEILELLFELQDINTPFRKGYKDRWEKINPKNLIEFAPYVSHVLSVDLFFYLAIHFNLVSRKRKSNLADIAYLYYLPFCNVFVSGDKLHIKTAPLFLKKDQTFVKADELKAGLKFLDEHYSKLPEEVKKQGLMKFAHYPPEEDNLISSLWDKYLTRWRTLLAEKQKKPPMSKEEEKELVDKINKVKEESVPLGYEITSDEADSAIFTRKARLKKGKWELFPPQVRRNMKNGH